MFKATHTLLPLIMMLLPFHVHARSKGGYVFSFKSIRLKMTTVKTKIKFYNLMERSKKVPCAKIDAEQTVHRLLEADHQHFESARQAAIAAYGGCYHLVCIKIVELRGVQGFNEFMARAPRIWSGYPEEAAVSLADVPPPYNHSVYHEPEALVWENLEGSR